MGDRILVTGSGGTVGRALVTSLAAAGLPVVAGISRPEATGPADVETRLCNFGDPVGMAEAMAGVDRLFLLTPFVPAMATQVAAGLNAAKAAGVDFVLRLSAFGAGDAHVFGGQMAALDARLAQSGLPHAVIRPNSFMQNMITFQGAAIRGHRAFWLPEADGAISQIDVADIAAAATAILADPAGHLGQAYDLTGPRALTHDEVAAMIGAAIGEVVTYHPVAPADARAGMKAAGMDDWTIDLLLSLSAYVRAGAAARVTGEVERLTGRPPRDFADFARENADAWR